MARPRAVVQIGPMVVRADGRGRKRDAMLVALLSKLETTNQPAHEALILLWSRLVEKK